VPKRTWAPALSAAAAASESRRSLEIDRTGAGRSASTRLPLDCTSEKRTIVSGFSFLSSSSIPILRRTGRASGDRKQPQTLFRGERRGGGGAGKAAPDDSHVAAVYAVYARFHTSSHTKRDTWATRAPGSAVSAISLISSTV
jgi:hypothetical protein